MSGFETGFASGFVLATVIWFCCAMLAFGRGFR